MTLSPLDLTNVKSRLQLPASWQKLEKRNFHDDILMRAYAHLAWVERTENPIWIKNARAFLSAMAKGFSQPFDRRFFAPQPSDPHYKLKMQGLDAIETLAHEFGDRVSSVVWDSYAHLATRKEPEVQKSILKEQDSLSHHYGIVDTMLHATGKVYTFHFRLQAVFYKHTGMILVLLNLKKIDGGVQFEFGSREEMIEATQSLFVHQCAESHLILNSKLPFEYTITKEAQELFGTAA